MQDARRVYARLGDRFRLEVWDRGQELAPHRQLLLELRGADGAAGKSAGFVLRPCDGRELRDALERAETL